MVEMESAAGNPNYMVPPTPAVDPTALPQPQSQPLSSTHKRPIFSFPRRPALRVTTEFDSDSAIFFHKISCKFLDSLAKLRFSFHNNSKGDVSEPQLSFVSKHLSIHYDLEDHNALVKSSFDVGPRLQVTAAHDVKAQQGEVTMVANVADPGYALELSTAVPSVGLPKATFRFPVGEVSLQEKEEEEEVKNLLSVSGILRGHFFNGVCTAHYKDEELKLRYCYKDDEMSFIPIFSLPSNALSFAFKRRLGPSDKLRLEHPRKNPSFISQVLYLSLSDVAFGRCPKIENTETIRTEMCLEKGTETKTPKLSPFQDNVLANLYTFEKEGCWRHVLGTQI